MIIENHIKTEKSARYYQLDKTNNNIKNLWIVFHGYGELAEEFISNFTEISNDETLIVAPEALNKFYLRGFYGKVGATWMTKEDRKSDIEDYVNLINNIFKKVSNQLNIDKVKITVLGFSQGTHTAVRWLNSSKIKIDNLLLWSGTFPHDCNYIERNEYWSNINSLILLGNSDKLISEKHIQSEIEFMDSQKLIYKIINYNGGHSIDSDQLISVVNNL